MYTNDKGGCGCGGSTSTLGSAPRRRLGHIDADGQCVCGECEPCNGLQCLCRPRFFDGQLLTAADLRRLDRYVVQKNRLHNRYLHGVGVACGLEVVCSPCSDTVTVRSGYALGPCGEDIVVCQDAPVDVARMVKEQRSAAARSDCAPYSEPGEEHEAARQQWVLGVCYDEQTAKPVTGLKRAGCSCGGSCGGACGGSCSSGASAPSSCEPTQICEGYRFTLTRHRPPARTTTRPGGDRLLSGTAGGAGLLPERVMACLIRMKESLTEIPQDASPDALLSYAADLKEELRELIETGNVHDCSLGQRLFQIAIPDPEDQEAEPKARAAIAALLQVAVDLFRDCVCSALLPPCADDCVDDCVPLAVLTVRSSDLRVLDVCNWSARKFVITMPTLSYWLGWIPVFGALRQAIARLCCRAAPVRAFELQDNLEVRAVASHRQRVARPEGSRAAESSDEGEGEGGGESGRKVEVGDPASFVALAQQYRKTWSSLSGLEATVLSALGGRGVDGAPLASELELGHPLAALALGRLGADAGDTLLPPGLGSRVATGPAGPTGPAVSDERIAGLEDALAQLRATVDSQARTIQTLQGEG